MSKDGLSYIRKAKTIANHLATAGDLVSDCDFMIFIVMGLGSNLSYTSFVTFVNMNEHKPLD